MRGLRVGIINPRTPFGDRVRALLTEHAIPVIELKLFDSETTGEATLSQFGDEVVVTQPVDADLFPHLDVLFVSGSSTDLMNRLSTEAASEGVLTLVEGAVGLDAPVAWPGNEDEAIAEGKLAIVPGMASFLVGRTLGQLTRTAPLSRSSVTVLVPAGVQGSAGADELHQQVVNLLNFKEPPKEVFGEQVAFNAFPIGSRAFVDTVQTEASVIAGMEGALDVSAIQVPVFHGYSASFWVEPEGAVDERMIAAAFRDVPFDVELGRASKAPSVVSVADSNRIHIGGIRGSGQGERPRFSLWAVADTTAYDPAFAAVELLKSVAS